MNQVCVRMPQACICTFISRTLEYQFLGLKAFLFDGPWPLDPWERPKPSK